MGRGNGQGTGVLAGAGARRTPARMIADALAKDQFAAIFGNRRGSSRGDDEGEGQRANFELFLPSGKAGFGQQLWPPGSALRLADELLLESRGNPEGTGFSDLVESWSVVVHTPGAPFGGDSDDNMVAWDKFHDAFEKYSGDGLSCVFGEPGDGCFATVTPPKTA